MGGFQMFILLLFVRGRCKILLRQVHQPTSRHGKHKRKQVFIELTDENILTTVSRVVTGLRFVKHNRIVHLQVQEGRLVQNGEIDPTTVRWVPVEDYKSLDKTIYEGQDYHTFSWEERGFELHDVMVDEGFVVTGARFRRVGSRIDLEVLTTPFNFTTGKLMPEKNVFKDDPRTSIKFK
jgi:hypothetical protein